MHPNKYATYLQPKKDYCCYYVYAQEIKQLPYKLKQLINKGNWATLQSAYAIAKCDNSFVCGGGTSLPALLPACLPSFLHRSFIRFFIVVLISGEFLMLMLIPIFIDKYVNVCILYVSVCDCICLCLCVSLSVCVCVCAAVWVSVYVTELRGMRNTYTSIAGTPKGTTAQLANTLPPCGHTYTPRHAHTGTRRHANSKQTRTDATLSAA